MKRGWPAVLAVAAALSLDVWACASLAARMGATNDLFPRWLAVRLWLERGWNPYSAETDVAIRSAMGSVPLGGERFAFGFVYPGYVALILLPLAALPFEVAATVWLLVLQACCVGGALLCWRAFERERRLPPAHPLTPMVVGALLPASVMGLVFLQFAAPVFAALAGSWWLLTRRRTWAAGALLVIAAIKPALAIAPGFAMLVQARSATFTLAAALAAAALAAASLAALPGWPSAFWRSTLDYASVAHPHSAASLLAGLISPAPLVAVIVGGAALASTALGWAATERRTGDALAAGAIASTWLVPPLYEWNNVVLLIPLVQSLRLSRKANGAAERILLVALAIVALATALAYTRWPSAARLIWPLVTLGLFAGRRLVAA
ncbi:MAG TPA: glycosyltransferase 87 family protein [Chloroflexota bacterium]|nr:glycosyltransferase 87 family protein [Chloroflexota bacterium]